MKKLIVGLMVISILFTACGQASTTSESTTTSQEASGGSQETETTETAETQTSQEETSEPVEIEFWHALGGDLGDGMQAIIDDFNASQSQYVVEPVVIGSYSEIDQKLQAAYAAKTVPALVVGGTADTYYQKGLVEAFEDYMPDDYDKDDIGGGYLDAATHDGKMWFAPAYGTSQVLYYNKAIMDQAGKSEDDFETWQSLGALSDDVIGMDTGNDTLQYVWEPMWGYDNIADMVSSNGGTFLSDDGTEVLINSEEWVEVLEQVREWIHDDGVMKVHNEGQGWEYWYNTMDDWVYGKSLGYTGSPGDYTIALDAVTEAIGDGYVNEFAVAHQPGWGDNDPAPYFTSLMYFIPKSDNLSEAQKEGAAAFITFATNTENTASFSMATGYAAVRKSVLDLPEYQEYLESNPDAEVALEQIDEYGVPAFVDPTGGAITDALSDAVDEIELENKDVQTALDDAQKTAQKALDKVLAE